MFERSLYVQCAMVLVGASVLAYAAPAASQDEAKDVTEYVKEEQAKRSERAEALDATLSTTASASLTSNKDVVGEINGFSALLGLGLTGDLLYVEGAHQWQNSLSISESWARTPALEVFVKNNDQLDYESLYNYFVLEWLGPFARFNLETSVFETNILTAEATDFQIARADGTTEALTGVTHVNLASNFEPLTLNESLGVFAEPVSSTPITWKVRLGAGARETFADGVLAVQDDEGTADIVELVELRDVFQGGLEGFTGIEGKLGGGQFSYRVGASALVPFLNNDPEDRSALELIRWGLHAGLEMAVVEWLSVNYKLNVLKDPQLLDVAQIQNNLMLTFSYTLLEADKEPEPTPAEEARKLREDAAKAEAEAAEMRKKALAIEETLDEDIEEDASEASEGSPEAPVEGKTSSVTEEN